MVARVVGDERAKQRPGASVDTEIRGFMLLTHYNTRLATIYLLRRDTPWVWLSNLGFSKGSATAPTPEYLSGAGCA